jgi:hypothetical protein
MDLAGVINDKMSLHALHNYRECLENYLKRLISS